MYSQITANKRTSWLFMVIMVLMIVGVSVAIAYINGGSYELVPIALLIGIGTNLIAFYQGDKIALSMNGAKEIQKEDNPYVYRMVENLCITAGLPTPKVYIMEDPSLNAFATGRDPQHASIAMTTGIIQALENEELEGVIAHELSHVKNYDIRMMMLVAVLLGTLMILIDWGLRLTWFSGERRSEDSRGNALFIGLGLLFIILAPIIGELIKLSISRQREYLADASGSLLTRYPEGLATALEKIEQQAMPLENANHATAHLFLANPFGSGTLGFLNKFLSTHPPIADRIARLRSMGRVA